MSIVSGYTASIVFTLSLTPIVRLAQGHLEISARMFQQYVVTGADFVVKVSVAVFRLLVGIVSPTANASLMPRFRTTYLSTRLRLFRHPPAPRSHLSITRTQPRRASGSSPLGRKADEANTPGRPPSSSEGHPWSDRAVRHVSHMHRNHDTERRVASSPVPEAIRVLPHHHDGVSAKQRPSQGVWCDTRRRPHAPRVSRRR